jgi:two-component system OmpR family response regulator
MQVALPMSPVSSANILLVEDDAEISRILVDLLDTNGFKTSAVASAGEMDAWLNGGDIDLVILDILLPDEDGLSVCKRLRSVSGIPIIMLTALKEDVDRILGLEIGADDYVTKPFNPRELIARVRALLRRAQSDLPDSTGETEAYKFAGWRIDCTERQLYDPDGARVSLTTAEFDILAAFCRHSRRVLSREQLLELSHGGLAGPIERTVDVHIFRIRQKIEADPAQPQLIKTVRLGGYVFTPAVVAA